MDQILGQILRQAVWERLDLLDELATNADARSLVSVARTELPRLTDGWRTLLEQHNPDERGHCPTCSSRWRPQKAPCSVWQAAHEHLVATETKQPARAAAPSPQPVPSAPAVPAPAMAASHRQAPYQDGYGAHSAPYVQNGHGANGSSTHNGHTTHNGHGVQNGHGGPSRNGHHTGPQPAYVSGQYAVPQHSAPAAYGVPQHSAPRHAQHAAPQPAQQHSGTYPRPVQRASHAPLPATLR